MNNELLILVLEKGIVLLDGGHRCLCEPCVGRFPASTLQSLLPLTLRPPAAPQHRNLLRSPSRLPQLWIPHAMLGKFPLL